MIRDRGRVRIRGGAGRGGVDWIYGRMVRGGLGFRWGGEEMRLGRNGGSFIYEKR